MQIKKLSNTVSVSGQITTADINALAEAGIKTIICNRPDGEDIGQTGHQQLQRAAEALGINFYFMPVVSGAIAVENGQQFMDILQQAPHPVHAYCRSGTRCTILWALAKVQSGSDPQSVIQDAASAGYNIAGLFET